jgi:hypothetical protein
MLDTPLETVSDYLTDARTLLLDVIAPYRYDDPSLLIALNVTLLDARRLRPDLFVYKWCEEVPNFQNNDNEEVEIEYSFRLGILYGLVGHALARDQEDVEDARATSFLGMFKDILVGPAQSRAVLRGGSSGK